MVSFSIALFMRTVLCNEPETSWISPDPWYDLSVPDRLPAEKRELTAVLFLLAGITQSLIAGMRTHCDSLVRSVLWKSREPKFQVLFNWYILIVLRLLLNDGGMG